MSKNWLCFAVEETPHLSFMLASFHCRSYLYHYVRYQTYSKRRGREAQRPNPPRYKIMMTMIFKSYRMIQRPLSSTIAGNLSSRILCLSPLRIFFWRARAVAWMKVSASCLHSCQSNRITKVQILLYLKGPYVKLFKIDDIQSL